MPIAALPQSTVRAIGSTSVISDSCSVVKELIDNALDASATSIFIEISQNTVDAIQVKDNGHGIPSSDHAVVCRRAYTSKIQTVDDLRKLGGRSLGFRGEALASAAEVSETVIVTTRIEAELVGSSIKYGRNGDLVSSQRTSHPVGTTVRIANLFKHIPVRRQTALKSSVKTLGRMKKLLQEYATSQPSIRLSLKVLKAKNENNNWMYAPKQGATMMDAALKIIGADAASICTLQNWLPSETSSYLGDKGNSPYEIIALLPNVDADVTKVNNTGQYINVDGRPISTTRGIGQEISRLYKSYLRAAASRKPSPSSIIDPFLCLQVKSNGVMYDVNIEPAKDDVLFENPQDLLDQVEDFFSDMYGEKKGNPEKRPMKGKDPVQKQNGFDLLLARKSPPLTQATNNSSASGTNTGPQGFTHSTSDRVDRLERPPSNNQSPSTGDRSASSSQSSRDSLFVTEFNTPIRRPRLHPNDITGQSFTSPSHSAPIEPRIQSRVTNRSESAELCLPSPTGSHISSVSDSPLGHPPSTSVPRRSQPSPKTPLSYNSKRLSREKDRERYGNGSLDTWFGKTTQISLSRMSSEEVPAHGEGGSSLGQLMEARFGTAENSPSNTSENYDRGSKGLSNSPQETSPIAVSRPRPPLSSRNRTTEVSDRRQEFPVLEQWSSRLHQLSNPANSAGLEEALDFENRKKEAILKRREQIKHRLEQPASVKSPHHSRYLAARAALSEDQNPSDSSESLKTTALDQYDSRLYLMRHQSSQQHDGTADDPKPRRAITRRLPFESIPQNNEVHDIGLTRSISLPNLSNSLKNICKTDLYTKCGSESEAFPISDLKADQMAFWTTRLSDLVKEKYRCQEGSRIPEVKFDFSSLQ